MQCRHSVGYIKCNWLEWFLQMSKTLVIAWTSERFCKVSLCGKKPHKFFFREQDGSISENVRRPPLIKLLISSNSVNELNFQLSVQFKKFQDSWTRFMMNFFRSRNKGRSVIDEEAAKLVCYYSRLLSSICCFSMLIIILSLKKYGYARNNLHTAVLHSTVLIPTGDDFTNLLQLRRDASPWDVRF